MQRHGSHSVAPLRWLALALIAMLIFTGIVSVLATGSPPAAAAGNGAVPAPVWQVAPATPTATATATSTPSPVPSTVNANQCSQTGDPNNAPDAYEPGDNTQSGATLFATGTNQTHTLCSATTGLDVDWYVFDGVTSQQYTIQTGNLSAVVDTYIVVQGPNGFQVQDDDSAGNLASRVTFTPADNSRFFIQVTQSSKTPFLRSETDQPRAYTIFLSAQAGATATPTATVTPTVTLTPTLTATPSPCRDAFEYDNDQASAKGLFVRKSQSHFLCGDGDMDWVWFDAVAGKPYRITTGDLAEGLDTLMVLYAPDGKTVLQINDDYAGLGLASRIELTAAETARYYLKVQDSAGHGAPNFSYTLRLDTEGLPTAGPCLDPFEPDGLPAFASEILIGESQAHAFCPEGDADWVHFYVVQGKRYTLTTSNLTIGTDTFITVFGPSADGIIAQDDDGGGGLATRVDFVAPSSGTYYAQIKNAGDIGGKGQRYTLALSAAGVAAAMPATATPTSAPLTATPAVVSTPVRTSTPGVSRGGAPGLTAAATPLPNASDFADPSFAAIWARTDEPVRQAHAARSWSWGAAPGPIYQEPYKGAPGGRRLVQYFDKARMEITRPGADRGQAGYVTNGLLVREMIGGQLQVGDAASEARAPAAIPLAGDGDEQTPTYASLTRVASLEGDRRVPNRVGLPVREQLTRAGKISDGAPPAIVVNAVYIPATGHNIPDLFWQYLNQRGLVLTDQGLAEDLVGDWMATFGLPLTEAYWIRATTGGVERAVLVQAFERRIVTYTPDNPPGWQVEMGNVGQHYHGWRYGR